MLYTSNGFIFSQVMYHEVANHRTYLPVLEKELEIIHLLRMYSLLAPEYILLVYTI